MYRDLEHLLARFHTRDLQRLISPELQRDLEGVSETSDRQSNEWLAKCVIASQGTGLLRNRNARKGLFRLLPGPVLVEAAEDLTGNSFEKPEDNALALSRLRWAPGSAAVALLAEHFSIPFSFLPHSSIAPPTVLPLEVRQPLPSLHPHQVEVRKLLEQALRNGEKALLVQMPTGSGKTRTALEALVGVWGSDLKRGSLVWLAHAEELCEQAAESVSRIWTEKARAHARLVRFFSDHEPPPYAVPGSLFVGSLQKVYSRIGTDSSLVDALKAAARVVVIDEAHRALAPSFRSVIESLTQEGATLVGLSATPGRGVDKDRENRELSNLFGNRLISPRSEEGLIERLQEAGILARLRRRLIETGIEVHAQEREIESVRLGFDYGSVVLRTLSKNQARNRLLTEIVKTEVQKKRPTIVFACTVEHARMLSTALNLDGYSAAYVDSEMDREDRRYAIEQFRDGRLQVLFNFGVLTTGFDAPSTRTVVVARPTTSAVLYGQMVGRALRGPKMGGGEEAWVIDVSDNLSRFGGVSGVYDAFDRFWGSGNA